MTEQQQAADTVDYPRTYGLRVYHRGTTSLRRVPLRNADPLNLPHWPVLQLRIEGEETIGLADVELLAAAVGHRPCSLEKSEATFPLRFVIPSPQGLPALA